MRNAMLSKAEIDARRAALKSQVKTMRNTAKERAETALKADMSAHGITAPVASTREAMIAAGLVKPKAK